MVVNDLYQFSKDTIMDIMTDLTLQDFNPLSKHVKYAQVPDELPVSTRYGNQSQIVDHSATTDVHTEHSA